MGAGAGCAACGGLAEEAATRAHAPVARSPRPPPHPPQHPTHAHPTPPQATTMDREIEVSHWGNVYFEERVALENAAAELTGEWSRFDFEKGSAGGGGATATASAVPATLPPGARSLYFKDGIGNISTSHVSRKRARTEVTLSPRFPLAGGWKADFVFGYSLPLREVAQGLGWGRVRLTLPFFSVLQGTAADDLTVTARGRGEEGWVGGVWRPPFRVAAGGEPVGPATPAPPSPTCTALPSRCFQVVLPEGATGITPNAPHGVAATPGLKRTYLTLVGRPTLTFALRNAVPAHQAALVIEYALPAWRPLVQPMLASGGWGVGEWGRGSSDAWAGRGGARGHPGAPRARLSSHALPAPLRLWPRLPSRLRAPWRGPARTRRSSKAASGSAAAVAPRRS